MRDLLQKNLTYKLVALFLAVVLWMNASDKEAEFRQQVVEVPLEVRNLSSSFVASDLPEKVKVQVEGEWSVIKVVNDSQFSAFVRLDSYGAGEHEVPVEVTVPAGVRLVKITPSVVKVRLTEMSSLQVPVVADIQGEAAEGFTMLKPVIEPAEVIISGPYNVLKKIRSARVKVSLKNARKDFVDVLPVVPSGVDAEEYKLTVNPSTAKISISIIQEERSKTVPVEVAVEGTPLEGYTVGAVQVQPGQVSITGAPEAVNKISSLKTLPVDVSGLESSFTGEVRLEVPEAVQVAGDSSVKVTVEILKQE